VRAESGERFQVPGFRFQGSEKTCRRECSRNPEPATRNRLLSPSPLHEVHRHLKALSLPSSGLGAGDLRGSRLARGPKRSFGDRRFPSGSLGTRGRKSPHICRGASHCRGGGGARRDGPSSPRHRRGFGVRRLDAAFHSSGAVGGPVAARASRDFPPLFPVWPAPRARQSGVEPPHSIEDRASGAPTFFAISRGVPVGRALVTKIGPGVFEGLPHCRGRGDGSVLFLAKRDNWTD